jgi:hypothetical protein
MVLIIDQLIKPSTCAARFGPLVAPRAAIVGMYKETQRPSQVNLHQHPSIGLLERCREQPQVDSQYILYRVKCV